jgi:two-component system chemotaxis sensor kinase CheA
VNDRRKALVGKFRASAIERVRRIRQKLAEEGAFTGEPLKDLRRDLHTLKGESTMLGFGPLSELFHAAEERLVRAVGGGAEAVSDGAEAMSLALEVVLRSLDSPELDVMALAAACAALTTGVSPGPTTEAQPSPQVAREPEPDASTKAARAKREKWVQVQAGRIDDLCERASEFEVGFRALHYKLRELVHTRRGVEAGVRALLPELDRAGANLEEITGAAWALRLVYVEPAVADLVNHAREIAAGQGKQIRVVVRVGDAQIERTVLDVIWEPLLHLVRNAVDHGIEPVAERVGKGEATLTIEAEAVGAHILLSISDNGRGIDLSRLRATAVTRGLLTEASAGETSDADLLDLIFLHGFSTRATVSDLSGRGIGLDVVRSSVESLGGSVRVSSEPGVGTEFTLSVPATISKERALVFRVGKALYALPSRTVASVIQLSDVVITNTEDGPVVRHGDETLSLRSMGATLGPADPVFEPWAAIVEVASRRVAFSMDRPLGEIPLLRRPVDRVLSRSGAVNGSAILEDGRLVLILAPSGLLRQSERHGLVMRAPTAKPSVKKARVLVVDDSAIVRDIMTQVLEHAGFDVAVAAGGEEALGELSDRRPHAILLDVDMPGIDGFETLRRIRERDEVLPVLMLSLRASASDKQRAAALGATAYFVKSQFEETTIVEAIRRFVEAS